MKATFTFWTRVFLACAVLMLPPAAVPQDFTPLPLVVTVLSGQGLTNSPHSNASAAFRVLVQTSDGRPANNALVQFQAPFDGPGGNFPEQRKTLEVTANAQGLAVANGFEPNHLSGPFEIAVTAMQGGQSGFAIIRQENTGWHSGITSHPWLIAAGVLVLGAAAGGTVIAMHHHGSSSATISSGGVTVGAPQ